MDPSYRGASSPPRDRTRAYRPARLTAAGLALLALAAALTLLFAVSAHASVWVIPASSRAFPTTAPGARDTIVLDAAGNEYEGVQVVLRGGGGEHAANFSWGAGSDPLITGNTRLHRVYYVKVTTPTSDLGSRPGWYPDPLVPRDFGQNITIPGNTTPFYLLTHVPYGTPPGDYSATLHVVNGASTVDLPMSLHVWNFGWTSISTKSSVSVSLAGIEHSIAGSGVSFGGANKSRILYNFYAMMRQHGISPDLPGLYPKVTATGHIDASAYVDKVAPFLDPTGLDLPDTELPWVRYFPWSLSTYGASAHKLATYLTELCRIYKNQGWHKKAYVYILDETQRTAAERQAESLARALHRASAKAGFRCRFLLTDDPRPFALGGVKDANKFLYDDVDAWALRYYYFFGRIPAVRERQAQGKEIWWYPYTNTSVARLPSFVIDKPHIDSRSWGWLMQRWNVDGLLNWGFNRWGLATTGKGYRDPYKNPLSLSVGRTRSNGDTSLVYPGYYPRYGLDDPFAAPVSSLRFEALRDGLEEREYLKLARRTGSDGPAFVKGVLATITQFPYPIRQANVFNFPKYTHSVSVYAAARHKLADRIEQFQK
jgi:hypothetical protein